LTRAAFLDRDGTINVSPPEGAYITRPEDLELLPGAAEAIAALNAAGWLALVITNQRGVARGLMTLEDLERVHARLEEELARAGARLDGIYACPHEEGTCDCRKPATGLFDQARAAHPEVGFEDAVVIGDSWRDMRFADALGLERILVADDRDAEPDVGVPVDHVARSLRDAVGRLSSPGRNSPR
jgi:D-glycero-D-manno-heptose 1,7-bisphosphate phosphatase